MSVPFTIRSGGRRFEGRYRVNGHHLEIATAYGARRAPLGLELPLKLAKALYRVVLRDVAATADSAVSAKLGSRPEARSPASMAN